MSRRVQGSRSCPHRCVCYEQAQLVDCHGRWLERVPGSLPHGTWLLELGANNLSEAGTRAFTGLWSLRVLVLTNSRIQPQAFFSLSFLEKLDLSWNQLTSLPVDFSVSLSAVRELRLERNNLQHIHGYSLQHLDNVEKLDLSYNQLASVRSGIFRGLSRLRQLYLHNNQLTSIQQGSLDMLPGLEILQLAHNSISDRRKILHVRHLHIDDYHNVTCQDPPQLAGESLAWVDSQLCVAETATVLVISGTVLVTVVAAMVMAERNRKKSHGKNWDAESQSFRPDNT
ncbi:hypothetical protein LDENG_00074000 [Lucifuga dentata]|nr:hypothetical protein LDENG_00074000 [Lucifuga dentata]